jgi:hypothetical protein
MWISLFAIVIAVAICLSVTAVMMPSNQDKVSGSPLDHPSRRIAGGEYEYCGTEGARVIL